VRLLVVITDSVAMEAFERGFQENGDRGFTIVPRVIGRGRTGLRTGDRVHPGGLSLLFTAVAESESEATLGFLREIRDHSGATRGTKIFSMPVEDVS
jgi:Nitrogen regulatory protein P-II